MKIMYAKDFEFDRRCLSDFGFTCITWNGDPNASSNVANIEFTTKRPFNRSKWNYHASNWSEPLTATFEIAMLDCEHDSLRHLTPYELSHIMRWINRRDGYKKFRLIGQHGYQNIYFNVQINARPLRHRGMVYALELSLVCDRPFGIKHYEEDFTISSANGKFTIEDVSDDVGTTPITMFIVPSRSGELTISNSMGGHVTSIKDCTSGVSILLNGEDLIAIEDTTNATTPFARRFNYRFPTLKNTYEETTNVFTVSLPCTIHVEWDSPVKVGI